MNKNVIDNVYKWTLRFSYFRLLLLGIGLLSFATTLLISDYVISSIEDFNIFIIIITGVLGLLFITIGLIHRVQVEFGIKNDWHKKDIE